MGFSGGLDGKEYACNVGDLGSVPGLWRSLGRGHGNPLQHSCLENSHGQKSLEGCSPWGCKELDMTEWLSTHTHMHTHILWSQHCYCNSHCTDENQILRLSILHEASEKQCWHLNLNLFLPALCSRHYRRHLLPQSQIHPLTGGGNQQPQVNALILANCFTNECCLDDQEEHRG